MPGKPFTPQEMMGMGGPAPMTGKGKARRKSTAKPKGKKKAVKKPPMGMGY